MRSKFNSVFALVASAALSIGATIGADAATVGVAGVNGVWTSTDPTSPPGLAGINTNSVSWGIPQGGQKSGYSFVGAAAGEIETGVNFNLGTFTHNNFVIDKDTSIRSASLGVIVDLVVGGVSRAVNVAFDFKHDETDNLSARSRSRCADGGRYGAGVNANGCADRVSILDNRATQQSFDIDGFQYILEITGFTRAGQFFADFWTQEGLANSAILQARFTLVGPTGGGGSGEPVPSPVPLPAAGWMMLAGIAALTAARARRKS